MKITIVGAGNVGATVAFLLAQRSLGQIVLVDIAEGIPQGKGLDIQQSCPIMSSSTNILGTHRYEDTKDSDLVVITAGLARKPGMSREDLLLKNADIVKNIVEEIMKYSQNPILVMVTNPLDLMAYHAWKVSKLPAKQVIGQAGVLDGARFKAFLAQKLHVSSDNISTIVLGGHGDTMVPLPRFTSVSGIPMTDLLSEEEIEEIIKKTKDGGAEIVNLLKTGSAYYAPASATVKMIDSIVFNQRQILASSVYLNGQYGLKDLFIGVPVVLGKNGVEQIVELKLTKDELMALHDSAKIYKENIQIIYRHD